MRCEGTLTVARRRFAMVEAGFSLNVTLAPELERFVQTLVESGRYQTANDVVSAALGLLQEQGGYIEPLHARVDDALASLTRGDGAEGEAYVETPGGELEESQEDERSVQR